MTMSAGLRRFALVAHVIASVGWLCAAVTYLVLTLATLTSHDAEMTRFAYLAMAPANRFSIIPLAFASLLTGLISALGTSWGLFRHYWVVVKFLLTIVAFAILLGNLQTVDLLADMAAKTGSPDPSGLIGQILHSGGGAVVLLIAAGLGMLKPRGLTPYGWRKQQEQGSGEKP